MKEKLLAEITKLVEGKNLSNIKGKTLTDYVDAISAEITTEADINESFLSKQTAILTSINGMYNADRASDKEKYDSEIAEFKKNYKPAQSTETQTEQSQQSGDTQLAAMQAEIDKLKQERAEEKAVRLKQDLISEIKSKCNEDSRKRFSAFVDEARVDFDADANTNYAALYSKFEVITKPEVDESSVGVPNGAGGGIETMFDQYKSEPK